MTTAILVGNIGFGGVLRQRQQHPLRRLGFRTTAAEFFFPAPGRIAPGKQLPGTGRLTLRVSSVASVVETKPRDPVTVDEGLPAKENILACPVCYQRLTLIGPPISVITTKGSSLQCDTCQKTYLGNDTHVELIAASGLKEYTESTSMTTEFFKFPLISYVYERGWRQGFSAVIGFPGPEQEFEMMKEYLQPVLGGNIIDASCGSGQFTRIFAKSGLFSQVIALDYSENMLKECYEFIQKEEGCPKENVSIVQADISRLPFATGSIDAVHAGAAIHCWPSPSAGVAEVSRVLRPGGVFIATTGLALADGGNLLLPLVKPFRASMYQITGSHIFVSDGELEDLCRSCGLIVVKCVRNRRFVMVAARKPT
ncbi:hypothetical protein MLD38_001976 [Melastoma candidum]|uniref:Uncharacterized protein n=1 Tax=Melastoma candidum TaxID=119954 RepID=A0ACB9SG91_9MYRT|nr:hypothetical protein MLD38_001976 [Melastoma candidum]